MQMLHIVIRSNLKRFDEIWRDLMIFDEIWRDLLKFDEIQWDSTRCDEIWRDLTRLYKIIYLWDGPSWLTQHYRTLRTCRTGRPALPTSELAQLHVEPKKYEKLFVNSMISSTVFIYYIKRKHRGSKKRYCILEKMRIRGAKTSMPTMLYQGCPNLWYLLGLIFQKMCKMTVPSLLKCGWKRSSDLTHCF